MAVTAFLASKHLGGLAHVLPAAPADLRTLFVPTAGSCYESAPWSGEDRDWLVRNGFTVDDLELATASPVEVEGRLRDYEFLYVAGGNTYFLLWHMQRTGFWDAFAGFDGLYVGVSAGAIVTCSDVAFIDDLDERELAPQLTETTGAGLVAFAILPHVGHPRIGARVDEIRSAWSSPTPMVGLKDDEAIVVEPDGAWRIVSSPRADLAPVGGYSGTGNS